MQENKRQSTSGKLNAQRRAKNTLILGVERQFYAGRNKIQRPIQCVTLRGYFLIFILLIKSRQYMQLIHSPKFEIAYVSHFSFDIIR